MVYTLEQLKEQVLAMLQSMPAPTEYYPNPEEPIADAIIEIIRQDRQAHQGYGTLKEFGEPGEYDLVDPRFFIRPKDQQ